MREPWETGAVFTSGLSLVSRRQQLHLATRPTLWRCWRTVSRRPALVGARTDARSPSERAVGRSRSGSRSFDANPGGRTASHWNFSFLVRPAGGAVAGCRFWSDHRKQRPPCGRRSSKSLRRLYGRGLRFRKSPAPSPPCESFLFFSEPGSGEVDAK